MAHVLSFGYFALNLLPIAVRHVTAVRPSFPKFQYLAGSRESARTSAFERPAHRDRETFDRRADCRACLRSLACYGDHPAQTSLAFDSRKQLRVLLLKSLETVCDLADLCF